MTFRIFSDDARKAISDHIIGAPPAIPNRYGANAGTDLLVQAGDAQPPPYNPKPPGIYLPGGSYPPGGPSSADTPPSHTPGQTAQIACSGGFPADNTGNCPKGLANKNGKLFTVTRQVDANGLAYCCPTETPSLNQSDQQVPQTNGVQKCPPGFMSQVNVFKQSEQNTPLQRQPYSGKTPNQYIAEQTKFVAKVGGTSRKVFDLKHQVFIFTSCFPLPPNSPLAPPAKIPTPPPTDQKEYDGDDKNSMPDGPDANQIVFRARPLQDIGGGDMGYCQVDIDLIGVSSNDCKNIVKQIHTTAKSTGSLATDCSKATPGQSLVFCRNPGASTIERGTPIIAVKDFTGNIGGIVRATIVVVPCST